MVGRTAKTDAGIDFGVLADDRAREPAMTWQARALRVNASSRPDDVSVIGLIYGDCLPGNGGGATPNAATSQGCGIKSDRQVDCAIAVSAAVDRDERRV
jgi:hypothetical protein